MENSNRLLVLLRVWQRRSLSKFSIYNNACCVLCEQIEDLSQQSAVRAVNQFKTPEAGPAGSDIPTATQATIAEESDGDDEEVRFLASVKKLWK